jgi:hypothetical protein
MHGIQTGVWLEDALTGLKDLSVSCVTYISPFWLIFLGLFRKNWQRDHSQATKAILLYIGTALLLLVVIILITGTTNIKERWLQPYLFIFPLLLFMQTSIERVNQNVRIYIWTAISIAFLVAVTMITTPMIIDLRGKPSRANYPFKEVANTLHDIVDQNTLIHAEDMFIGGNLLLFLPKVTVITPSLPLQSYKMRNKVVVVYHKKEPKGFLKELSSTGYTCKTFSVKEKYTYSSRQIYRLHAVRCQKS